VQLGAAASGPAVPPSPEQRTANSEQRITKAVQEDRLLGRISTTGAEDDHYWRQLSDN